jgi:hypothetical protein
MSEEFQTLDLPNTTRRRKLKKQTKINGEEDNRNKDKKEIQRKERQ